MLDLLLLVASGLIINGMHGYLLWSQRGERKWSLSAHAIKARRTHALYIVAHTAGGFLFLLFAQRFFLGIHHNTLLFALALTTYFFELWQAVLPSKGKLERAHSITAYLMWVSFLTLGLISIFVIPQESWSKLLSSTVYVSALTLFALAHFNTQKLYYYQMWMVILFLVSMSAIVIGSYD